MADTVKSQLEMLSEDSQGKVNYVSWRFKLNLTLKTKGLFPVATGVELKPHGTDTDVTVKSWIKKDLEAQTLIGLNVSSNIAQKIANCVSSKQMLDKLETLYDKKSDVSIEGLQRLFFSYKYDESKSATENCMQVQQYADELSALGEQVKESWIVTRVLGMLPPKLHHFRVAWDSTSATDKNISNLIERLRLEEDRLNGSEQTCQVSSQNALVSKQGKKSGNKPQAQGSSQVECFKCGQKGHVKKYCKNKPCGKYLAYCKRNYSCNVCSQKGHFAKDCPKGSSNQSNDQRNNNDKNESKNQRAFVTIGLSVANLDFINSKQDCNKLWYQDCGATQHMTSHKE